MEPFFENLGLCHIGESILKNLDFQSQLICRLVKKSWKNILEKVLVTKASKFSLEKLQINKMYRRGIDEWKEFWEELKTKLPIHIINSYVQHLFESRKMYPNLSVQFFRPLGVLAVRGNLKMVQLYLGLNSIPISKEWGSDHYSALQLAAKFGRTNVVKYLKKLFSTAIPMGVYKSAIYCAAWNGKLETLKVLMDDLKNPDDSMDGCGWVFLGASRRGYIQILRYLEQKLSKEFFELCLTSKSPVDNTVFHVAACHGRFEMLTYLCQKSPNNIMQLNKQGDTPIHSAAGNGHLEIVRFLTAYTSNPNTANGYGLTPSSLARSQGFFEIEDFLLTLPVSKKMKLEK